VVGERGRQQEAAAEDPRIAKQQEREREKAEAQARQVVQAPRGGEGGVEGELLQLPPGGQGRVKRGK
jgi:hypothetical protein